MTQVIDFSPGLPRPFHELQCVAAAKLFPVCCLTGRKLEDSSFSAMQSYLSQRSKGRSSTETTIFIGVAFHLAIMLCIGILAAIEMNLSDWRAEILKE